jgi:hypothetical protein
MGRKKDDAREALVIVIALLIFAWVYRSAILAWLSAEIAMAISGLISFLWTLVIAVIEFGVPLVVGWYLAEALIERYSWPDSWVTIVAIVIIIGGPYFLTGYLFLITIIGWGMAVNILFRFINSLNL